MIRVTAYVDDIPRVTEHPDADGFKIHEDGDVTVSQNGQIVAAYVNRFGVFVAIEDVPSPDPTR